jgi:hypothetical protein
LNAAVAVLPIPPPELLKLLKPLFRAKPKMKKALMIVFIALTTLTGISGFAQMKKKVTARPTAPVKTAPAPPDPLSSFQVVVKKFTNFFSGGPRKLAEGGLYNGKLFAISEYTGRDIAYDVEKTSSLVSPYSATIQMNVVGKDNRSCGDVRVSRYKDNITADELLTGTGNEVVGEGWSSMQGALSALDRTECYTYSPLPKEPTVYGVKFVFAFQEGKWVFKDAVATNYAPGISLMFLSLWAGGTSPITHFTEGDAQTLNSPWENLIKN